MTLLEKFEENILEKQKTSFKIANGNKYYHFVQVPVGSAHYIYGEHSWYNGSFSQLDLKYKLVAIVKESVIYIVDRCFFDLYSTEEVSIPKTIKFFNDFWKEINEYVTNEVFPKFYEKLKTDKITDDKFYGNCQQTARNYMLSNMPLEEQIKKDYFSSLSEFLTEQDAADIICDIVNVDSYALEKLEKEKESWLIIKATVEKIITYTKDPKIIESWELDIIDALNGINAKTVNVEFTLNGKTALGKMEPDIIIRNLKSKNNFWRYDFVTTKQGEELILRLNASSNRDKNALTCKNISKITYKRKELYVKRR
mgnify:CR=1 FL=1